MAKVIPSLPKNCVTLITAGRDFSFVLREGTKRRRASLPSQFLSTPELLKKGNEGVWKGQSVQENPKHERAKSIKLSTYMKDWKEVINNWEVLGYTSRVQSLYRKGVPPTIRGQVWPVRKPIFILVLLVDVSM